MRVYEFISVGLASFVYEIGGVPRVEDFLCIKWAESCRDN